MFLTTIFTATTTAHAAHLLGVEIVISRHAAHGNHSLGYHTAITCTSLHLQLNTIVCVLGSIEWIYMN